jgi:hypothetical protein
MCDSISLLICDNDGIVQVPLDRLRIVVALGNHKIRALAHLRHLVCPFTIARVRDHLVPNLHAQKRWIGLSGVSGGVRRHAEMAHGVPRSHFHFDVVERKLRDHHLRAGKERFRELVLLEERIKRAVIYSTPGTSSGIAFSLGYLHDLAGWTGEEHRLTVDEPASQPWARDPVAARLFSGRPFHPLFLSVRYRDQ